MNMPFTVDDNVTERVGSCLIKMMLNNQGIAIGRLKVDRLMAEIGLICKQPGPHAYKQATVERLDVPNVQYRQFDVAQPNQVWCGDITYIWTSGPLVLAGCGIGFICTPCGGLGNV